MQRRQLLWALASPLPVSARCPRPLLVPVAHAGTSVSVIDGRVGGVFPEFLRLIGQRAGCQFEFPIVPRARVARTFLEQGESDLLAPATRNSERDAVGQFVPMVRALTMLVALRKNNVQLTDVHSLLQDKGRVVVLRAYSWGDEYETLVRQLEAQGRLQYVADTDRIIERLLNGLADYSLIPPTLFMAILQDGQTKRSWSAEDFATLPLLGLPPAQVGVYLSRERLSDPERETLIRALNQGVRDGSLLKLYQRHVPTSWMRDYLRIDVDALPTLKKKNPAGL